MRVSESQPAPTAGLRIVVVGATGNVGTSVVQALVKAPEVDSVLGLARRLPRWSPPKTRWATVDIGEPHGRLAEHFRGADVVIHLAWIFQPTRDALTTWRTNVLGSIDVFDAVREAGVPSLVYSSSVGAYSTAPKGRPVDESWPTHGWPDAAYCREKSYLERVLDSFEQANPEIRVVRMRPGFIFKKEAATEQRRLFAGPLLPAALTRPAFLRRIPDVDNLVFQVLHAEDAAEAYRSAALGSRRGAFNLAADPVVTPQVLAKLLGARTFPLPVGAVRATAAAAWHMHIVPASPQLLDAVLHLPIMSTERARAELGWSPHFSSSHAIGEFLTGLAERAGLETPPLASTLPGGRFQEFATGVGERP